MTEQLPIFDRVAVLELLGNDEALFHTLAGMFVEESAQYVEQIAEAAAAGDLAMLEREAHTIKGLLATFADTRGVVSAQRVEEMARDGRTEAAAVAELQQLVAAFADLLRREIVA
jgi:histidine phosphotransfer protein HptB